MIACTIFFVSTPLWAQNSKPLPDDGQGHKQIEKFIETLETVRSVHPDIEKLSYERLVNFALEGMLGSLDRFSAYYHPESAGLIANEDDPATEQTSPSIRSLGFDLVRDADAYKIDTIHKDSAAEKAGLASGDSLLKINGRAISDLGIIKAFSLLHAPPGSLTRLTLLRKSDDKEYEAELTHRIIFSDAISIKKLLTDYQSPYTGYIVLEEFTKTSHREMVKALDELEDAGMKKLILDLRGNPGGLLTHSILILGEFLPPNTEVVTTQGRSAHSTVKPLSTPKKQRRKRDYPLIVLIDKNSASASELVSAALRDLERAQIVGETSFGKGSVQNIRPVKGGGTLRLTTATYHTPSGKTPHRVGVTPDIVCDISDDDRRKAKLSRQANRLNATELEAIQGWKDPVLLKAIGALK